MHRERFEVKAAQETGKGQQKWQNKAKQGGQVAHRNIEKVTSKNKSD